MARVRSLTGVGSYLCSTRDLSLGGLSLEFPRGAALATGDLIEVRLVGHGEIPLECEVMRVSRDGAVGVRYLNLSADARKLVQRIVTVADPEDDAPGESARKLVSKPTQPLVDASRRALQQARPQVAAAESVAPVQPQSETQPSEPDLVNALRRSLAVPATVVSPPSANKCGKPRAGRDSDDSEGRRSGTDLFKALRAATGESAAVSAKPIIKPAEADDMPGPVEKTGPSK